MTESFAGNPKVPTIVEDHHPKKAIAAPGTRDCT